MARSRGDVPGGGTSITYWVRVDTALDGNGRERAGSAPSGSQPRAGLRDRHLRPLDAVEPAPAGFRRTAAPLLEEKRDALRDAPIAEIA